MKQGKGYIKAVQCHLAYLTSMQSTYYEMPGWMNHKLESRLPHIVDIKLYINNLKYADNSTLAAESEQELKSLLMKMKEE